MSKDMDFTVLLDVYGGMLTKKQNEALSLYYNEDLSLGEIADITGITRQGVHNSIRTAEEYLVSLENTLGCVARYKEQKQLIEKLKEKTQSITDKGLKDELLRLIETLTDTI